MQAERYGEAAAEFEAALQTDPALSPAREHLAVCRFETRNYAEARRLFQQLLETKTAGRLATYYLGRIDLVENELDSAVRRLRSLEKGEPIRDELYYLGSAYYKRDEFARSAEVLERAARQNPRDWRVHQLLARAYQALGRGAEAEREFAETKRLLRYYVEGSAAINQCRSLLAAKQPEEAWQACARLIETDDVDKLVRIGMLFGEFGDFGHARIVWDKATGLDPESPEIQHNLALTCFHLKDLPCARRHAAEAVRLRPEFVEANILYGTILYMGAEDKQALAVLTRAHELKPDDGNVRRLLLQQLSISAASAAQENDWRRAAELLERAAVLDPQSGEIASRVAEARARLARGR